ncbi:Armadillo-type fold [Plasmopara halstedii]|uniref:Armadillo-type fold n=1 Tax=Plasmopara halstedii TaxID=4781 RepID=A0A0P1ALB9_PLAHL|nr:Armadillo-type fold [Plasmopara halstedii]CEG41505.1 Armadillo-type fold [Plasmopara halstedii]|eukprot:XP_024577874.1 Armadillo-type fold [Plasmopara halstedii]
MTDVTVTRRYSSASAEDLICSAIENENPTASNVLVAALNHDAVLARFIGFVTRVPSANAQLPDGPDASKFATFAESDARRKNEMLDEVTPELVASYRATMMLANDDTADALLTFLGNKSKLLTRCLFQVFQNDSQGSLRHACRVIDYLLRFNLDDVYDVLGKNAKTVQRYMGALLPYLGDAPVAELFLTLVCKPHSATIMRLYASTPPKKWAFFRSLAEWKMLLVLASHVCSNEYGETHTIGAADVFVELVDRLAADENGQLLLQPAAYCPEVLEGLIRAAVESEDDNSTAVQRTAGQRTAAIKCVYRLLQKSSLEKVQGPPTSPYQSFGATIVNLVPNQLSPLREKIYTLVEQHLGELLNFLIQKYVSQQNIEMPGEDSNKPLPETAVRHTAYIVKVPFTELRLTLVETLVEIMAHNPGLMSEHFNADVWRVLVTWFFEYSHNNLYHAAFYQLVFIALRTDNQQTLEVLVKKLKVVTLLIEHYRADGDFTSNKGYILQICNAIRLQAASQSPDAFLRNFLQSHTTWRSFEQELREQTSLLCVNGLGFTVPQAIRPGYQKDTWQLLDEEEVGIDHGSEFARSLGFVDDVAWPDNDTADINKKRKKKKKGKRNSHHPNSNTNYDSIDTGDTCNVKPENAAEAAALKTAEDAESDANGSIGNMPTTPKKKKIKNKKKQNKNKNKK